MQEMFFDAMEQLLGGYCTPAEVRKIEHSGSGEALWAELQASGFIDALVSEEMGGSGLTLNDVFPIAFVSGRHALPLPLAHTMFVRGLFATTSAASAGKTLPEGAIAIASESTKAANGAISCMQVSFGRIAQWVLVSSGDKAYLLSAVAATVTASGGNGSLDADFIWSSIPADAISLSGAFDWRAIGACVTAALLAGASERVFEITLNYANERSQFGKPIAKFQAIQQQLSVMAEQVFAAKMAAQIGFNGDSIMPSRLKVAVAKARASQAAPQVGAIGHAVHGGMGFTEEYDLQLFTRRLHEWRIAYGSEAFWNRELGNQLLQKPDTRAIDFIRENIMA
jgi:alkylation response protein AidB-like acyl-CoA dehydrogenase